MKAFDAALPALMPPDEPATVLPDLLAPGLRLVFCGTAAGARSAAAQAYYAHPGNRFWRSLHEIGLTPRQYAPTEYPLLLGLRIGLTDLAKHHAGNDNQLPRDAFDRAGLIARVAHHAPQLLAFTSRQAGRVALGREVQPGLQTEQWGSTHLFVLPSPSGQARGHWQIEPWQTLAELFHSLG